MGVLLAGQNFSDELLAELQAVGATCSRRELARVVCARLSWQGPGGQPAEMSARKALAQLQRQGHLALPAAVPGPPRPTAALPLPAPAQPCPAVLKELGTVRLVLVGGRKSQAARRWREIMAHHYLGPGPLCGAQLRYLIVSDAGYLGALAFSAAALQLAARDAFIGWAPETRREQLHLVVNNSRFLLLPWVRVPHLASHVLAQAARRLPRDWQARYGYAPVLLESFVETARFKGTSYLAAGWQALGETCGRGRQDRAHRAARPRKTIWLRALRADWRTHLGRAPQPGRLAPRARPGAPPPASSAPGASGPPPPDDWAAAEMGGAALGDARLPRRLVTLSRQFFARPQAHIPEACGRRAAAKAAYRFFAHPHVTLPKILAPHRAQTCARAAAHPVVLAVQDTTELDYTAHPATTGLGPIGNHRAHVQGLILHPTMVYTPAGLALGLLEAQCWARDPGHRVKFRQPVEQKESAKWLRSLAAAQQLQAQCPGTQVISVGDCEADMFELYRQAVACPHGTKFLVRAFRERALAAEEEPEQEREKEKEEKLTQLWESLRARPSAGTVKVSLPRRGSRPARLAEVEVRFAEVSVAPPAYLRGAQALRLWAVALLEPAPPEGASAVEWLLLTNLPVTTWEAAVEKTQWYGQRFQIEVFFRTLKSGCRLEDRQLGEARRLENCLAIDLVVAWRIVHLVKLGREVPELPCTVFFEELQWKALLACAQRGQPADLSTAPSLRAAVRLVAQLGGFLGRKGDGEPGAQTLWRGLQRLDDIVVGFALALGLPPPPVPSQMDYG